MATRNYWRLVGKLQYLVNTRPDIAYAVGKLACFASKLWKIHWDAGQRVLGYLRGSADTRLTYSRGGKDKVMHFGEILPECFTDPDFGGDKETQRSTTGLVIKLLGGVIIATSK